MRQQLSRRRYLGALSFGSITGMAGCAGESTDGDPLADEDEDENGNEDDEAEREERAQIPSDASIGGWGSYQVDTANTGRTYTEVSEAPGGDIAPAWEFETSADVNVPPAVVDGTVFVGNRNGDLYAVDAVTGEKQWQFDTGDSLLSAPAVAEGTVYVGNFDGTLFAVDAASGDETWTFDAGGWVTPAPTVTDGVVYVGSSDNHLHAVEAATGNRLWSFEAREWVVSAPAVGRRGDTVYASSHEGNLYAIDISNGEERWTFTTGGDSELTPPLVARGTVYIGQDGVIALDARSGEKRWQYQSHGGYSDLYLGVTTPLAGGGQTVYAAGDDGYLHAINANSGERQWTEQVDADITQPVLAGGRVYYGTYGIVHGIGITDGASGMSYDFAGVGGAPPVVVDGIIYKGLGNSIGAYAEV